MVYGIAFFYPTVRDASELPLVANLMSILASIAILLGGSFLAVAFVVRILMCFRKVETNDI
ncbi:hypothetical protein DSM104635_01383 [Terricaulis silvestris]|uniref:Uncharacterized protein n=1 Tax=Terricaulis silvestris TaxID=2686094 RepID=A0A6I6MNR6_9CAUL|nr:hypothetical protein DSM104635_01383 [Terricaulis silvestris]